METPLGAADAGYPAVVIGCACGFGVLAPAPELGAATWRCLFCRWVGELYRRAGRLEQE